MRNPCFFFYVLRGKKYRLVLVDDKGKSIISWLISRYWLVWLKVKYQKVCKSSSNWNLFAGWGRMGKGFEWLLRARLSVRWQASKWFGSGQIVSLLTFALPWAGLKEFTITNYPKALQPNHSPVKLSHASPLLFLHELESTTLNGRNNVGNQLLENTDTGHRPQTSGTPG